MRPASAVTIALIIAVLVLMIGCGGSSSPANQTTNNTTLTTAQAQQLANSVDTLSDAALSAAMGTPTAVHGAGIPSAMRSNEIRPSTVSCSGTTCTVTHNYTCPHGGTIGVNGTLTQTSASSATASITETPANCSDGTLVISGTPNVTLAAQATDNGATTAVNVTLGGGISFAPVQAGQFPTGTCSQNVTVAASVNDQTGSLTSCTVSGSVCGMNVTGTCSDVSLP